LIGYIQNFDLAKSKSEGYSGKFILEKIHILQFTNFFMFSFFLNVVFPQKEILFLIQQGFLFGRGANSVIHSFGFVFLIIYLLLIFSLQFQSRFDEASCFQKGLSLGLFRWVM